MTGKSPRAYNNIILTLLIILLVISSFLIHVEVLSKILNSLFFTLILLAATYAINKNRKKLVYFAVILIIFREAANFLIQNEYFYSLVSLTSVFFFFIIVVRLIQQVASSIIVDRDVILESVNGYLLIGLCASILFALVDRIQEHAFAFTNPASQYFSDYIYFGFITQTTIGYGDVTPLTDLGRLLAITVGISGQLYVAIIIAMLVGKYLSQKNNGS